MLVRKAIGASRNHLFVESVAGALSLAGAAGVIGVVLAHGGVWLVRTTGVLGSMPELAVRVDAQVLMFAVAISIGAAPAVCGPPW